MWKKETTILIIGNGFDLAHGLPTSYNDFLNFVNAFLSCLDHPNPPIIINSYEEKRIGSLLKNYLVELFMDSSKISIKNEFGSLLSSNIWVNYFWAQEKSSNTLWIDFEKEISTVIQSLYFISESFSDNDSWDNYRTVLKPYFFEDYPVSIDKLFQVRDLLIKDLNRFTRALELYLDDFVNLIPISIKVPELSSINIDKVLCFNYTNTFERLYQKTEIEYIHGKANRNATVATCDLVLGIDEYLDPNEDKVDIEFIEFKKFYQRILKKTGCSYSRWLERINQSDLSAQVLIYGHSLDKTDKDILCPFLNSDKTNTRIYYHTKAAFGNQIKKLVSLLGENRLIDKVHEEKIQFFPQKELVVC